MRCLMEAKFRAFMEDLKSVLEQHYPNTDIVWEDYDNDWDESGAIKWRVTKLYLDMEDN